MAKSGLEKKIDSSLIPVQNHHQLIKQLAEQYFSSPTTCLRYLNDYHILPFGTGRAYLGKKREFGTQANYLKLLHLKKILKHGDLTIDADYASYVSGKEVQQLILKIEKHGVYKDGRWRKFKSKTKLAECLAKRIKRGQEYVLRRLIYSPPRRVERTTWERLKMVKNYFKRGGEVGHQYLLLPPTRSQARKARKELLSWGRWPIRDICRFLAKEFKGNYKLATLEDYLAGERKMPPEIWEKIEDLLANRKNYPQTEKYFSPLPIPVEDYRSLVDLALKKRIFPTKRNFFKQAALKVGKGKEVYTFKTLETLYYAKNKLITKDFYESVKLFLKQ